MKEKCICRTWARDYIGDTLFSEHHVSCQYRNIEKEAKQHLENLLQALEYEASMGDGIADEFYDKYISARFFTRGII